MSDRLSLPFVRSGRRHPRRVAALCATLLLALLGACSDAGPVAPAQPPAADAQLVELAALVNQHRQSVGCGPLALHRETVVVSQGHSDDMVNRRFFAHVNPDGESPFDRLHGAGIDYRRAGENLAIGYPTAQAVFDGWLNSPGHRANLEKCSYTHHGLGLSENRWTHMFLSPS